MITIIIPAYKNKEELLKNLAHNIRYLKNYPIIIVNDYPDEDISQELASFKNVRLITNKHNLGFGPTVNRGVEEALTEFVMLLNTDVVLHDTSFEKGLQHFAKNKNLFAVSFTQQERNNTFIGKNRIYWRDGLFQHSRANNMDFGINGWAEGGTCLIDRKKFKKLGGFDSLYSPFYWEDIDLSYRAWKSGYTVLFDPDILVLHYHETTIGKYFNKNRIKKISYRNQLIFIWKNITDMRLQLQHFFLLPVLLLKITLQRDYMFIVGFFLALSKLVEIMQKRNQQEKLYTKNDIEILEKFNE